MRPRCFQLARALKKPSSFYLLAVSFLLATPAFGDVADNYYRNAIKEYERGEFGNALVDYNKAIELNPGFAEAYNNRGNLKQNEGDTGEALADYERAIKLKPDFGIVYYNRGRLKYLKKDVTSALADFNKAIELNPDFADGYFARGNLKYLKGDTSGALTDYNEVVKLRLKKVSAAKDMSLAGAYDSRGNLERAKGDLNSASADYDEALEINPNLVGAYVNRGIAKKAKGDLGGALADYNNALKIEPHNAAAYFHRGVTKAANGDFDGAMTDYAKALELNPKYAAVYRNRGIAKADMGDIYGAMVDDNIAIELYPKYTLAYRSRGFLHYNLREFADALADFQKYCELGSNASQDYSRFRIWLIRARLGEQDSATKELQTYLQNRKAQKPEDWPLKIGRFLTGELSEPDLFKAAEVPDKKGDDGRLCDVWFYAGSKRLIEGDKTTATNYFAKCVATNMKTLQDYQSAGAELKYLQMTNGTDQVKIDYSEMDQAFTNFFASLDAIVKMLPSVTNAAGTVQVVNAWSLANETVSAANERFVAKYPGVYSLTVAPTEFVMTYGKIMRLKTDYAAVPAGVGRLMNQFKDVPEVQEAIVRFRKSLDMLGSVGHFHSGVTVQTPAENRPSSP